VGKIEADPDPAAVERWLDALPPRRAAEARSLTAMMERVTGAPARLWGGRTVGFGSYRYVYASGRGGTWFLGGLGAAESRLSIHVMAGFDGMEDLLARIGPHRLGVSCLYLTRLDRADMGALEQMIARSVEIVRYRYPAAEEA
jgi:hypothetical protein